MNVLLRRHVPAPKGRSSRPRTYTSQFMSADNALDALRKQLKTASRRHFFHVYADDKLVLTVEHDGRAWVDRGAWA